MPSAFPFSASLGDAAKKGKKRRPPIQLLLLEQLNGILFYMGNITKNQHYIAECLLQHFTNNDKKLFELLLSNKTIYPTSISASMSMNYTYEHQQLSINTIEKYFSKIEGEISPKIIEIIKDINDCKNELIDFSLIRKKINDLLPIFIIFYYRSGALLKEFSNIHEEDKIPLLSNKILNEKYIRGLSLMIENEYNFAIIESNNGFIMSDQYVSTAALKIKGSFSNICNRTIGIKETLLLIPISSKYYAVYWHSESPFCINENSINLLNIENTNSFNKVIANNSYVKCISENENSLKVIINEIYFGAPSSFFAGNDETGYYSGAIKKKEVFFYEIDRQAYKQFLEFHEFNRYDTLGRNDICLCGSNIKFKKCHQDSYNRVKLTIQDLGNLQDRTANRFVISRYNIIELPIDSWGGHKK